MPSSDTIYHQHVDHNRWELDWRSYAQTAEASELQNLRKPGYILECCIDVPRSSKKADAISIRSID